MVTGELTEAYEVLAGGDDGPPVVLLCEHAGHDLPDRAWPSADRWLVGTHWSWDPGAAELTRELAQDLGCPAALARFTRLLVDPNRPPTSGTLFRAEAAGRPVMLNQRLSPRERHERLRRFYDAYHGAADRVVASRPGATVLSIHTFTPVYDGEVRDLEVGVLHDRPDEELAVEVVEVLQSYGLEARLNEPYSGLDGMMYSPSHHAYQHRRRALELEVRQDLALVPAFRAQLCGVLREIVQGWSPMELER